jgi:hypothetical protein
VAPWVAAILARRTQAEDLAEGVLILSGRAVLAQAPECPALLEPAVPRLPSLADPARVDRARLAARVVALPE